MILPIIQQRFLVLPELKIAFFVDMDDLALVLGRIDLAVDNELTVRAGRLLYGGLQFGLRNRRRFVRGRRSISVFSILISRFNRLRSMSCRSYNGFFTFGHPLIQKARAAAR